MWTWEPSKWWCARPCIGSEPQASLNCCGFPFRLPSNGRRLALAAIRLTTRSYVPNPFSRRSAEPKCRVPITCARTATTASFRPKPVLAAVGRVEVSRPYCLCSHCHNGQFPADVALDIENKECSPGVRRMLAIVGQEAPFDHGR